MSSAATPSNLAPRRAAIANAVRRWPHDPRIDLRAVPGFAPERPAAADWVEADRLAARRADQGAAGLIMLAAVAILAGFLFLPDALLTALMRGTF